MNTILFLICLFALCLTWIALEIFIFLSGRRNRTLLLGRLQFEIARWNIMHKTYPHRGW